MTSIKIIKQEIISENCYELSCYYMYCTNIINKNFQAEFESEGLRSQKISYYDNKKTVDLLVNVSCELMDLSILLKSFKTKGQGEMCLIIAFNIKSVI